MLKLSVFSAFFISGAALLLVTAACSSTSSGGDTTDGGTDATPDVRKPIDTGSDEDTGPGTCPPPGTLTSADIEAVIKWNPPAAPSGVCTQGNLDDLKALFAAGGGKATFAEIKAKLGTTCSECAFTQINAPNWGVFVENDGGTIDNSIGACFAEVDGNACGKAFFEYNLCQNAACSASNCGTDATIVKACRTKASTTSCKDLNNAVATSCAALQTDATACASLLLAIRSTCAGGPDSGIDASLN